MLRTTLLSLTVCAGAAAANAEAGFQPVNDRPFLDLIGEIEGPDGYDDIVLDAPLQPPRPITQMTINEVLEYQRALQLEGSHSSAVGRYQFIRKTLAYMVDKYEIDGDQLFGKVMQDSLARRMMVKCDFYEADASESRVGNCLARAWASLPMMSGEKAGQSYYGEVGTNKAHATRSEVLVALRQRFAEDPLPEYEVASNDPLPVIRNTRGSQVADRIPLEP